MKRVLLLKVHLLYIHPKIWRRFIIDEQLSFFALHRVLQIVMGWESAHLYGFNVNGQRIEPENEHGFPSMEAVLNDKYCRLGDVLNRKDRFTYTYDYGDDWMHKILVERVLTLPPESKALVPICLDGARACPPEDCGGPPGFENLLRILSDPDDEEYEDMRDWSGNWKPNKFSVNRINQELRSLQL